MKRTIRIVAVLCCAAAMLPGCNSDDDNTATPLPVNQAPAGNPSPPTLGATQVDRMGRAGINTALTNPFFRESVAREEIQHEVITDDYNAASDPSKWVAEYSALIETNLPILDGLDRTCGNQLYPGLPPVPAQVPGRYKPLADVLADDKLYVNTASGTCQQYLAVEANAIGVFNNDCGGRTPLEDTIETSYSILAIGRLTGVTSGVTIDTDGKASLTVFPFLDKPL